MTIQTDQLLKYSGSIACLAAAIEEQSVSATLLISIISIACLTAAIEERSVSATLLISIMVLPARAAGHLYDARGFSEQRCGAWPSVRCMEFNKYGKYLFGDRADVRIME